MKVKVISIQQPFASLVVLGLKKFETRSWRTKHEGELYIHASQSKKIANEMIWKYPFNKVLVEHFGRVREPNIDDLPFGAIIGKVNLVSVIDTDTIKRMSESIPLWKDQFSKKEWEQELAFGDFGPNRFGWLLSNPVAFEKPIPAKGKLSIWEFDMPENIETK